VDPQPPSRAVNAGYILATVLLVVTVVFVAFAVVSGGVGVARHGDSLLYGRTLTVPLELSPDEMRGLPHDVDPRGSPDVQATVTGPTTKQMLLRSATDLDVLVLFAAGLWLLQGFMRSVVRGDPFGAANVRRLRRLGFLLVAGAPAVELLNYSLRLSLFNDLPPHPSTDIGVAGFSLPGAAPIGGLGAFILAEVFAYGARLRADVEGTV
jgi:hypothetical protein